MNKIVKNVVTGFMIFLINTSGVAVANVSLEEWRCEWSGNGRDSAAIDLFVIESKNYDGTRSIDQTLVAKPDSGDKGNQECQGLGDCAATKISCIVNNDGDDSFVCVTEDDDGCIWGFCED